MSRTPIRDCLWLATGPGQTVLWRWEGDAFGATLPQSFGTTVNLRFPGQYFDEESGRG